MSQSHQASHAKERPLPPKRFVPAAANEAELVKYGFPPRPDEKLKPLLAAKWDRDLSRPIHVVSPTSTLASRTARPGHVLASGPIQVGTVAGAVAGADQQLVTAAASWTIPNIYPPPGAVTGEYYLDVLVGLDCGGWLDGGFLPSTDGLCAGTTSRVIVSGGNIISQTASVWYSYWGANTGLFPFTPNTWTSLAVKPGDTVSISVCAPTATRGYCSAVNLSSGSGTYAEPAVQIAGTQVDWWVGTVTDFVNYSPMPEFGVIFMYDTLAATNSSDVNLNNAKLLDTNPDPPAADTPVAQAAQVSPQVLEISAYNNKQ